jgi:hypothetical protein
LSSLQAQNYFALP